MELIHRYGLWLFIYTFIGAATITGVLHAIVGIAAWAGADMGPMPQSTAVSAYSMFATLSFLGALSASVCIVIPTMAITAVQVAIADSASDPRDSLAVQKLFASRCGGTLALCMLISGATWMLTINAAMLERGVAVVSEGFIMTLAFSLLLVVAFFALWPDLTKRAE